MDQQQFEWVWNDPEHLEAHRKDFFIDPAEVLKTIYDEIAAQKPDEKEVEAAFESGTELWFHRDIELAEPVGRTGLRDICADGGESFWGYRIGRTIPSHLALGEKKETRWLCVWGRWEPGRFVIHTIYPGRVAPREIHDPSLPPCEMQQAIEFWRCHAIVVEDREYSLSPSVPQN